MPNCPHCKDFYFGSPDVCPKCYYDFAKKRVIVPESVQRTRQREAEMKRAQQEQRQAEIEVEKEDAKRRNDIRKLTLIQNARYEYHTEFIADGRSGCIDKATLDAVLSRYAEDGWRLHSIFVNEAGKNMTTVGVGGFSSGTNSTMDITVLVFERCVKPAEYNT